MPLVRMLYRSRPATLAPVHGLSFLIAMPRKKAVCPAPPTTGRRFRMFPSNPFYPNNDNYTPAVFDLRYPGVAERLHRERVAWWEQSVIEALEMSAPCSYSARRA